MRGMNVGFEDWLMNIVIALGASIQCQDAMIWSLSVKLGLHAARVPGISSVLGGVPLPAIWQKLIYPHVWVGQEGLFIQFPSITGG